MSFTRQTFPAKLADLGFAIDVPNGFIAPPLPQEDVDFNNPTLSAPLLLLSAQVALAIVTVAARPAYADGSVMDGTQYLCSEHNITLTALMPGTLGGADQKHGAILAEGHQTQDGTLLKMVMAFFEDGKRLVIVHAMCPDELAPSYLALLQQSVHSIALTNPRGPTAPLVPGMPVPSKA